MHEYAITVIGRDRPGIIAETAEILAGLKKGDDVTTAGGIVGKVRDIKEDRVTIESGTATLVVERGRIVRVCESVSPGP